MSDATDPHADSGELLDGVLAPGDIVADKYEVEKVIGTGGMGTVVAACHLQLGKRVAIKMLHGDLVSDPVTVERFLREAQSTVDLSSEHAAMVSDVGTLDDGTPYIIMEHLEGKDLESLLVESGPLPVADAVDYVLQAAVALADAHQNGLVHRDLKPGNLFLTHAVDGAPLIKVLDFGITKKITKSSGDSHRLTTTGLAIGTPLFMSPEQIRDPRSVDHRTDIWALGAVLHELLVGMPPFSADTITALSAMIAADDPPPLRSLRSEVPEEVERAVLRCLEKRPDDRFADAAALAHALEPAAAARSRPLVQRIERILQGSLPPTRGTQAWHPKDDLADTVASTQPDAAETGPRRGDPTLASSGTSDLSSSSSLGQTAGAWDAGAAPKAGSQALIISTLAVAMLVALMLWEPWAQPPQSEGMPSGSSATSPSPPPDTTGLATGASPAEPATAADPVASAEPATATVSSTAAPSASAAMPPAPTPVPTARPRPRPSTPPAPKPSYNLLDERK